MLKLAPLLLGLLYVYCISLNVNAQPRLLSLPDPTKCVNRPKEFQLTTKNSEGKDETHNYYFSWTWAKQLNYPAFQKVDWLEARNQCRERCMDLIGIESQKENQRVVRFFREYVQAPEAARDPSKKFQYIWTSGRLCDFTGCNERKDLHPVNVFGWFWSNTNTKMAPTNATPPHWANQPWSDTGHTKVPQPDNAEFDINQTPESCLGVLDNVYKDGVKWHDIACYHKKPFICEDSTVLIDYIKATGNATIRALLNDEDQGSKGPKPRPGQNTSSNRGQHSSRSGQQSSFRSNRNRN